MPLAAQVLCSVRDVPALLQHVKRLLRPGGQLVFIEHTISPKVPPGAGAACSVPRV